MAVQFGYSENLISGVRYIACFDDILLFYGCELKFELEYGSWSDGWECDTSFATLCAVLSDFMDPLSVVTLEFRWIVSHTVELIAGLRGCYFCHGIMVPAIWLFRQQTE
jgi:hypothetical protein